MTGHAKISPTLLAQWTDYNCKSATVNRGRKDSASPDGILALKLASATGITAERHLDE
jgi:hypothetical protein